MSKPFVVTRRAEGTHPPRCALGVGAGFLPQQTCLVMVESVR